MKTEKRMVTLYIQKVAWLNGRGPEIEVTTFKYRTDEFVEVELIETKEIEIDVPVLDEGE